MAATYPAGVVPAGLPTDVAQMLAEADRWNVYADRMNRKALRLGLVTADQLAEAERAAKRAIRRVLDNYNLDADPDLLEWHRHLDRAEAEALP